MQQLYSIALLISSITMLISPETGAPISNTSCSWEYTFGDNFNGTMLDREKWHTEYPPGNHGELQYYAPDAFKLKDGALWIKAEKRALKGRAYTSGIITSKNSFAQQYGYFKMRAKLPKGKGFWSGFWLLPEKAHYPWEIDIFELLGDNPATIYMTHHWQDPVEGHEKHVEAYTGADFSADFHTFTVEWNSEEMIWRIDGVERHRTKQGIPQEPMFLLANFAVGGNWPGNPDHSTPFPSYFEIDYIEVYQRAC